MAFAHNGDVRLHWREDGAGAPLLLLNSVGCDLSLWNRVMPHLMGFRVLRMDMRGHGASDSPPGDYTLEQLAGDAAAVLAAAGVEKATVCGLSLGGMTAMTLALRAPAQVSSLILACTSARMDRDIWNARISSVRNHGMTSVVDAVMARFFSEEFQRHRPDEVAEIRSHFLRISAQGYAGCCAAIRDMDLLEKIGAIRTPTLIVAGGRDMATPFEGHGSEIARRVADARVEILDTGHIAPVEKPQAFATAIRAFAPGPP